MEWLSTGFRLVTGFTDHLQIVTANNDTNIAISTLYIRLENTVLCPQPVTKRFLVTASINDQSSASALKSSQNGGSRPTTVCFGIKRQNINSNNLKFLFKKLKGNARYRAVPLLYELGFVIPRTGNLKKNSAV
jgi:hypothetical protein